MNIVLGSIQQETNSFNPVLSTISNFVVLELEAIYSQLAVADFFKSAGSRLYPTLYAHALPGGRLAKHDFTALLERMLDLFPSTCKIDGIWLYCHGALDVEGIGSGDLAIVKAVRHRVGPDIPLAVALDFHANLNKQFCQLANIVCGYRTAPHTDMAQTQLRAASLLVDCIRQGKLPQTAFCSVPLIITGDKVITEAEPMRSIIADCLKCSQQPGILDTSVFNGQPWVDAPDTGASTTVVAQDKAALPQAEACARQLALRLWNARDKYEFQVPAIEPELAVLQALAEEEGPVFISDSGDNTTAGAEGNSIYLLRLLLQQTLENVLLAGLTAKITVDLALELKPGQALVFPAGESDSFGKLMQEFDLVPTLKSRGRLLGWYGEDAGDYAVLSLPGLDMLLTRNRAAVISPEIINSASICFDDYRVIVVKLGYLYPDLAKQARKAYLALTPGASCEIIENIAYENVRRPVYPLDQEFSWQPGNNKT